MKTRRHFCLPMCCKTTLTAPILALLFSTAASHQSVSAQGAVTDTIHARPAQWSDPRPGGLIPSQIRHAYGFDQISCGARVQTVAIIEAYGSPTLYTDVNAFLSGVHLGWINAVPVYYSNGKPTAEDPTWALQTTVDLEWAYALNGANISLAVVVAKTDSLTDLLGAVDYAVKKLGASQVAMPWGAAEFPTETSYDSHFNHPGVTFFAPAGEGGPGVLWPATSPYVVAVGGTTLITDSIGNRTSELGWPLSGGGASAYEAKPSFQNGWQSALSRTVPDVSYADGSGFLVAFGNQPVKGDNTHAYIPTVWVAVGGTSAGATQWAMLMAYANSARSTSLSNTGAALYSIGAKSYSTAFFDITSNYFDITGGFLSGPGYDLVTGLGSPVAPGLVPALIAK